jgi:hypothetical protein
MVGGYCLLNAQEVLEYNLKPGTDLMENSSMVLLVPVPISGVLLMSIGIFGLVRPNSQPLQKGLARTPAPTSALWNWPAVALFLAAGASLWWALLTWGWAPADPAFRTGSGYLLGLAVFLASWACVLLSHRWPRLRSVAQIGRLSAGLILIAAGGFSLATINTASVPHPPDQRVWWSALLALASGAASSISSAVHRKEVEPELGTE